MSEFLFEGCPPDDPPKVVPKLPPAYSEDFQIELRIGEAWVPVWFCGYRKVRDGDGKYHHRLPWVQFVGDVVADRVLYPHGIFSTQAWSTPTNLRVLLLKKGGQKEASQMAKLFGCAVIEGKRPGKKKKV